MVYPYCLECRGTRDMCRQGRCELLQSVRERMPSVRPIGKLIEGPSPPDVFVGQYGYPTVGVGPLVPPSEALDDGPVLQSIREMVEAPIEDVVAYRSTLFHTRQGSPVRLRRERPRILELAQEVAMSAVPVDTEVELSRPVPSQRLANLDPFAPPRGPGVEAERGRIVGHPVVPRRVDALVSDIDAGASTAARELYGAGVGEDHILRLFSVGLLGRRSSRKLVPTRWSITAVDDILSKDLAIKARGMQELGEVQVHSGVLKGNHFHVLLVPRPWAFEMVEAWVQGSLWAASTTIISDREGHDGRSDYASNVTGAYYAARLAVLEHLTAIQRQATAIVYREVTEEYWAPLGVWVIREGMRSTMRATPERFDDVRSGLQAIGSRVRIIDWHRKAEGLHEMMVQRKLEDFDMRE